MTTAHHIPQISILVLLVVATIGFLIMAPYFAYVFRFLDPRNVVHRLQSSALDVRRNGGRSDIAIHDEQRTSLAAMEELSDIAFGAMRERDRAIATECVDALRNVAVLYLPEKRRASSEWFEITQELEHDPDFVAMAAESVTDMVARQVWFEWKVLRQFQTLYTEALIELRDLCYIIAINTRYVAEAALKQRDDEALLLSVKFMNTYVRATLNANDVRTAYNVFNQYRLLVETLMRAGRFDLASEISGYFRYYGHLAQAQGLRFVTEVVAYDLAQLVELAHELKAPCEESMLQTLLEVDHDDESDDALSEQSLRGVRKAQTKLATYYLAANCEDLARRIYSDMANERGTRLHSIRDELSGVVSREFWEINDRGHNFDYLPPERRALLAKFFSWFDEAPASLT